MSGQRKVLLLFLAGGLLSVGSICQADEENQTLSAEPADGEDLARNWLRPGARSEQEEETDERVTCAQVACPSDVDPEAIESADIACDESCAASCKFREHCGAAPLNQLTRKRGPKSAYVINGTDAIYGEWPSFARLNLDINLDFLAKDKPVRTFCGAVLLSDRHVLTAAHCVIVTRESREFTAQIAPKPIAFTIRLGDHEVQRLDAQELKVGVKDLCVSRFHSPFINDWALLELDRPIRFNDYIQPACLPFEPVTRSGPKAVCYLVGAGKISSGLQTVTFPKFVQKMRVESVTCAGRGLSDLDRSRECWSLAPSNKGNACSGDSGGPILCLDSRRRWTVMGLVSYGRRGCEPFANGTSFFVATRLRTLLDDMKQQCNDTINF